MANDFKLFRDPIYSLISFDKIMDSSIIEIINTKEFQRLRRIKQLGFSSYTFPTAVHDRFSHSIGVSYVVGILFDNLGITDDIKIPTIDEDGNTINISLSKEELRLLLQLAGLLHDIGHGPFSHAFEKITGTNHEEFSKLIIQKTQISQILSNIEYSDKLKKYSEKWIIEIIDGTFQPIWVKELISSQLDSDRIDYLLRDAYMCGVSYASFDTRWLFNNFEIDQIKSENDRFGLIVNAKKGLHAIESFIVSRYHMYEQVYFHKTTRGFEVITQNIFKRLLELQKERKITDSYFLNHAFFDILNDNTNIDAFFLLDDYSILCHINHWIHESSDNILKNLCESLVYRNTYKMVKEVETDFKEISDLQFKIRDKMPDEERDYLFFIDDYKNVAYKDPYLLGEKNAEKAEHIWLKIDNKQLELSEKSPIIKSLKNTELKKYRAYLHRDYLNIL